jgi:CMP-N-acetylneuraminic acid synthetase
VLRELSNRLGGKIAVYRMNMVDSIDIDEPEDFQLIERLLLSDRA